MPVPEAAMDKKCESMARQYDVWTTRKVLSVKAEAQAVPVQEAPHADFRPRIARSYPLHIELPLRWREYVGHRCYPPSVPLSATTRRCDSGDRLGNGRAHARCAIGCPTRNLIEEIFVADLGQQQVPVHLH